jgi:hypothetical protein
VEHRCTVHILWRVLVCGFPCITYINILAFLLACLYQASLYQTAHLSIFLKSPSSLNIFTVREVVLISNMCLSFPTEFIIHGEYKRILG